MFVFPTELSSLADDTFMNALRYPGSNSAEGAAKLLLRDAIVAVLNASHPDVNSPLSASEIANLVNDALASMDRKTMLDTRQMIDQHNTQGDPLSVVADRIGRHPRQESCPDEGALASMGNAERPPRGPLRPLFRWGWPPFHTYFKSAAISSAVWRLNPASLAKRGQSSTTPRTPARRSRGRRTPKRSASPIRSSRAMSRNLPFALIRFRDPGLLGSHALIQVAGQT
jgi:hypothetical protein